MKFSTKLQSRVLIVLVVTITIISAREGGAQKIEEQDNDEAPIAPPHLRSNLDEKEIPLERIAQQQDDDGNKKSYRGDQVIRVPNKFKQLLQEYDQSEDFESWGRNDDATEYYIGKEKLVQVKKKLDENKVPYEIIIDDLQRAIDLENPPMSEDDLNELAGKKGHRMTWDGYHRLSDIHGYLDFLAETYANNVTVGVLGNSVEGRPIKYIKISSGEPNAKAFWIDGGIHAREWISPASVSYIINEFVENREAHLPQIKGVDFYVVPVLNPDGYEYTHTRERLWRKNRSKSFYCAGTDLNRNWGYKWGGKGSSRQQCREIYAGTRPFSEPETTAASNFVLQIPNRKAYVTFHSYGQYILYPFGYDSNVAAPDRDDLERVGHLAATAMAQATGTYYTVGNSAQTLYPASGGADDWAKGVAKIKYTYTIELRDRGQYGFVLPAQYILPTAKEALAAVKAISSELQNTVD